MRKVAILGIGQTKIGEQWEKSLREIGGEAIFAAMQDAGIEEVDSLFVGNMLSPLVSGQNQLGAFLQIGSGCGNRKQSRLKLPAVRVRRHSAPG
jgi:acetyl-CoA C-acetyltransferase